LLRGGGLVLLGDDALLQRLPHKAEQQDLPEQDAS